MYANIQEKETRILPPAVSALPQDRARKLAVPVFAASYPRSQTLASELRAGDCNRHLAVRGAASLAGSLKEGKRRSVSRMEAVL